MPKVNPMNDHPSKSAALTPEQQFLNDLWEEHIRDEFTTRDTTATLDTMVPDAYVNHVPVLTGGVGCDQLREFYSRHFIPKMPPDTQIIPISRTIGAQRLVDEMIFRFTHTVVMDWMLPGVAPTGKPVECGLVVIVDFRDGKLAASTFTGTRPRCWFRWVCSIRRTCRSSALNRRENWPIITYRRTS